MKVVKNAVISNYVRRHYCKIYMDLKNYIKLCKAINQSKKINEDIVVDRIELVPKSKVFEKEKSIIELRFYWLSSNYGGYTTFNYIKEFIVNTDDFDDFLLLYAKIGNLVFEEVQSISNATIHDSDIKYIKIDEYIQFNSCEFTRNRIKTMIMLNKQGKNEFSHNKRNKITNLYLRYYRDFLTDNEITNLAMPIEAIASNIDEFIKLFKNKDIKLETLIIDIIPEDILKYKHIIDRIKTKCRCNVLIGREHVEKIFGKLDYPKTLTENNNKINGEDNKEDEITAKIKEIYMYANINASLYGQVKSRIDAIRCHYDREVDNLFSKKNTNLELVTPNSLKVKLNIELDTLLSKVQRIYEDNKSYYNYSLVLDRCLECIKNNDTSIDNEQDEIVKYIKNIIRVIESTYVDDKKSFYFKLTRIIQSQKEKINNYFKTLSLDSKNSKPLDLDLMADLTLFINKLVTTINNKDIYMEIQNNMAAIMDDNYKKGKMMALCSYFTVIDELKKEIEELLASFGKKTQAKYLSKLQAIIAYDVDNNKELSANIKEIQADLFVIINRLTKLKFEILEQNKKNTTYKSLKRYVSCIK